MQKEISPYMPNITNW